MGVQWRAIERRLGAHLVRNEDSDAWALIDEDLRRRPGEDAEADRLEFLSRATQLAAQFGAGARALGWIEAERRRRCGTGRDRAPSAGDAHAFRALTYGVLWTLKDYAALARTASEIDWDLVPPSAWSGNLRLASAIARNRHDEVLLLASRLPREGGSGPPEDSYQRGFRLSLLGFHRFERGDLARSLECFRQAFQELTTDGTFDARLKRIGVYGHWGKAAFREGRIRESERLLERAVRAAHRYRHALWYNTFRVELAHVVAHRGAYRRAERLARSVSRHSERLRAGAAAYGFLHARSLLSAGGFAADEGDVARARRYERRAARALRESAHPRLPGYLHLLRGRIEALQSTPRSRRRARREFARAEEIFRSFGSGDATGLALLFYHRGHLHIAERDVEATLADAVRCVELARTRRFLPAKSSSLLLRSQLLLQQQIANADRLYEGVLRDLGSVHDPVVLFRVIANLYLYSWELDEQLDLTDCHMRQIYRMKELLEDETFHCLYDRFVAEPVARRFVERTLRLGSGD